MIANPSTIISTIGTALPQSSNFFVTYVLIQARLGFSPSPTHLLGCRRTAVVSLLILGEAAVCMC